MAGDSCCGSRSQVDEVKVFETFGGDLPVDETTVKLESKPSGRPDAQESNMIDRLFVFLNSGGSIPYVRYRWICR
ncbi:hypothetical protein ACT8ZS_10450 [Paenibacillus sp. M.A.Huq-84]